MEIIKKNQLYKIDINQLVMRYPKLNIGEHRASIVVPFNDSKDIEQYFKNIPEFEGLAKNTAPLIIEYVGEGYFKELSTGIILNGDSSAHRFEDQYEVSSLGLCLDENFCAKNQQEVYNSLEKATVAVHFCNIEKLTDANKTHYAEETLPYQSKISTQLQRLNEVSASFCEQKKDEISEQIQLIAETDNFIYDNQISGPQYSIQQHRQKDVK